MRNYIFFSKSTEHTTGATREPLTEDIAADLVRAHDKARDTRIEGLWKVLTEAGVFYLCTFEDYEGARMAVTAEERETFVKAAGDRPVWELRLRMIF